jgi:hypothetical protein
MSKVLGKLDSEAIVWWQQRLRVARIAVALDPMDGVAWAQLQNAVYVISHLWLTVHSELIEQAGRVAWPEYQI